MSSRRNFLQNSVLGLAGSAVVPFLGSAATKTNSLAPAADLAVGIAGYTFYKFSVKPKTNLYFLTIKSLNLYQFVNKCYNIDMKNKKTI
jgi:hypothetical protein